MRVVYILLTVLFFYSCNQSKNDAVENLSTIVKEKRVLYSFKPIDLIKTENYILTIRQNDKFIIYSYVNVKERRKNMRFSFNRKNKKLHWGPELFAKKEGELLTKENEKVFNFYRQGESSCHQTQPILFNKEYGVLGIYNFYGPDFVFVKEKTKNSDLLKGILTSMENFNPN